MKLLLSIGVSKAPPLSHLPGAITAAWEMGNWGRKSGFKTSVITDGNKTPVTIARIRKTLLRMLPINDEVELFILHFAGHGFRTGAEQNVWLPSDWYRQTRAISVEGLKRQLYRHGIKSLSIFADACRSLPTDIDTADIFGDPVLPRGPYDAVAPIIDRINAVADGQQAYMLNGDGVAPPRCIFSTVLVEGLCGLKKEAFDKHQPDCVIPESLALFARDRLKEIGETYDLKCSPDYAIGIPREHVIYYRRGQPLGLPNPQWPAPSPPTAYAPYPAPYSTLEFQACVEIEYPTFQHHFLDSLSPESHFFPRIFNLATRGALPKKIWSTSPVEEILTDVDGARYRLRETEVGAIQVLVEFDDGIFASAVVYEGNVTLISRDEKNEINWTFLSETAEWRGLWTAIHVIEDLQTGNLSADQVDVITAELREAKHINPTLGAIASYLYDYTGDIDTIRRMAFFFCVHGQPIPFDVAFMGLLSTHEGKNGILAEVPPIPARPQSLANGMPPDWVTRATDRAGGQVAGLWPWLRQGWQFIEDPAPQERAAAGGLRDVAKFLLPSQFSSFKEQGARILIDRFNLEASE